MTSSLFFKNISHVFYILALEFKIHLNFHSLKLKFKKLYILTVGFVQSLLFLGLKCFIYYCNYLYQEVCAIYTTRLKILQYTIKKKKYKYLHTPPCPIDLNIRPTILKNHIQISINGYSKFGQKLLGIMLNFSHP